MRYSTLETALFKPILRRLRENPQLHFWSLALEQCYKVDEERKRFSETEEEIFKEFSHRAVAEMERYHSEVAYYFTKYGWEGEK